MKIHIFLKMQYIHGAFTVPQQLTKDPSRYKEGSSLIFTTNSIFIHAIPWNISRTHTEIKM